MVESHAIDDVAPGPSKEPETPSLRHSKYYFDDQQSVFLVEKTFFKVHRYFLVRESEVFRTMFSCPSSEGGQEGVDESKPIHLPGITCRQFEALLEFFYGRQHANQVKSPAMGLFSRAAAINSDLPRLLDLLSISTFYDFGIVRECAIRAIEANGSLDPIDKLRYANQCDIPEWLVHAYKALCQRSAPLEISEAERIGFPAAILVAKAREQFLKQPKLNQPQKARSARGDKAEEEEEEEGLSAIVRKVFFDTTQPT